MEFGRSLVDYVPYVPSSIIYCTSGLLFTQCIHTMLL